MSDAVKVGFVPFSTAPRGILVVFCDDTLKFGAATRKALGAAADMVKRAAATNQFKGKSGSTLDILAPRGAQGLAPDRGRRRQALGDQGQGFSQIRRCGGRQAARRQRRRDRHRGIADRRHEARAGGRGRLGRAAARLQIRPLQDQEEGRRGRRVACRGFARGRRCRRGAKSLRARRAHRRWRHHRARTRQRAAERALSRGIRAPRQRSCASSASTSRCSTSRR